MTPMEETARKSTPSRPLRFFAIFLSFFLVLAGCGARQTGMTARPESGDSARLVKAGEGICRDLAAGLMWQEVKSRKFASPEAAAQYAASLELGGFSDWRLPTPDELLELHLILERQQAGDCAVSGRGSYWSRSVDRGFSVGYWETVWTCSPEFRYRKAFDSRGTVRAVRP